MGPKAAAPARKQPAHTRGTPAERLKRLFTSLCAQIDGGHFANALKTCDKILRTAPADADALQTKRFLLLQTEQYTPALALIAQSADGRFERAYALYRLHREDDAEAALRSVKESAEDHRGVLHLEAQLAYRQGSYQAAVDLYNQLLDTAEPHSEEQSDILTNLDAAQAHLDFLTSGFQRALARLPAALTSGLETSPPPAPSSALAALASAPTPAPAEMPARKVRAKRVPAGVVPGVTPPPDPERWLKKSERTVAASGRRRKGGGGATQGAMEGAGTGHGGKSAGGGGGKGKKKK